MQVDGLVLDVPDEPTHHTFGRVLILLVDWYSHIMGSNTYVQLLSYNYVKTQYFSFYFFVVNYGAKVAG
jgi:hypothetical protein